MKMWHSGKKNKEKSRIKKNKKGKGLGKTDRFPTSYTTWPFKNHVLSKV